VFGAAGRTGKARTYKPGRVCVVEGCETRLSMYNPSPTCALHTEALRSSSRRMPETVPRREPETRRCAYAPCGREFVTANPARKYC
jgi:hypothetical protein